MWLTGFDAPSLHTMYIDKPMRGHGLMQAIARVNRVFKDKPGGLVVDYLGLADELKSALATYTEAGGTGKTAVDQAEAVSVMLEKYEICCGLFHGFSWTLWTVGTPAQRLGLLPAAQEHILAQQDGKDRLLQAVTELSAAFALAVPHEDAIGIRDDVGFFQAVRAVLAKSGTGERKSDEDLDHAIRQIISKAIVSGEVVDIFAAAGLRKPDISILSDEFLAEVRGMPQRNLAVELLQKLLRGEIKQRSKRNVVQARSFADLLDHALRRYQNRAIETAQVIEELIQLAKDMRGSRVARRDAGPDGRRAGVLRCAGDERQRGPGARRRDAPDNRARAGRDGPGERDDRLDGARERARAAARDGQAHPAQVRLPTGQAGEGDRRRCWSRRRCCRRGER